MARHPGARAGALARKAVSQVRLLWTNPEELLRNVRQFTNPDEFLARLLDMPEIAALRFDVRDGPPPSLNVLIPVVAASAMTGGPNTMLNIAYRLACAGMQVRFIASARRIDGDTAWFWSHLAQLTGISVPPTTISLHDGCSAPVRIGADDIFMAGFWTTAHQAAAALQQTRAQEFLYLIQDFEPGFYPWSSRHAMALETYAMPFRAIVNESMLMDYLFKTAGGRFSDPAFRDKCTAFEPAIDRSVFFPAPARFAGRTRRVLVYTRPTNPRNLLGMAVAALRAAAGHPAFAGNWEFLAIGARGSMPQVSLGGGRMLGEAPWLGYAGYADLLRSADILLCPMLSPHTSYPVLEMAACGGWSVTNAFATKTPARLQEISPNIVVVDATVAGFEAGLIDAAGRGEAAGSAPGLSGDWDASLREVVSMVQAMLAPRNPS